ncbi:MalY/PatB family protein [Glycomyces xiaoerkulensis]|uniref:MalY/PatB family protein n=1 Tax=Glycomyces xiaoerkulensis TaxID=2038139 RepID=UPI000C2669F4|nr:aminotransferase class I/II-fold pyridoxal phosphate-dependent enzyme [Glycomyces xiaoerkulensis]
MFGSTSTPPGPPDNPLRRLTLDQLRRRTSVKWRAHPGDVLPLWVAEIDAPLAEPVAAALTDAIAIGDTGYPSGTGYAEALSAFAAERWNWTDLAVERTRPVPDVMGGTAEILRLLTAPGDAVAVNCPVYPPFYGFVRHIGRRSAEAPLGPDGRIDFAALEAAFARPEVTAFLLCNPHNPTGTVHTAAELAEVAALAENHGVRVVADEIHAPLIAPGTAYAPFLTVPGGERALAVTSASKAWNLAGLKAAVAVAGTGAVTDLERLSEEVGKGASHFGIIAHTAALREGGAWLDALLTAVEDNRRLLGSLLAERLPAVAYRPHPGTYLAWLDCRDLGLGTDPAAVFLERGRVALNSGLPFGTGGAGRVRLNLATSPEILTEAVDRMAAAVE